VNVVPHDEAVKRHMINWTKVPDMFIAADQRRYEGVGGHTVGLFLVRVRLSIHILWVAK